MTFTFGPGVGAVMDDRFDPYFKRPHCFIALTPPVNGWAVFVNFSSVDEYTPDSHLEIVLEPGAHPFITKRTCIPMTYARIWNVNQLTSWVNGLLPAVVTYAKMDPQLHARLIEAVIESEFAKEEVKDFLIGHFGGKPYLRAKNCIL